MNAVALPSTVVVSDTSVTYQRRWWTLAVLCLSLITIGLDNTILNVALPTLVRELGATITDLQWIVDAYVLVFAGCLLTAGALGDRFGRKLALNVGLLVFGAASAAAAFATSPGQLIAIRAVMGIGGAFIMPSTLSILTNVFPPAERARAIAIWAAMSGLGIPLGPTAGGWLLERYHWGAVFFVNLPVIALALVAGWFLVPESRDARATPLDPVGALLSMGGLAALVYAIIEAPHAGWSSASTLTYLGIAAVLLAIFLIWELRTRHPMLDVRLFRNPRFSAASGAITLVFFALFGSLFFLTQYLQFVLRFTALEAGVRVIPVVFGLVPAAPLSARLVERFGSKVVIAGGLTIASAGLGLLSTVTAESGYGLVALTLVILGAGMGTTMAPATESVMGAVPRDRAGVGSAVNDTTRQVGGALGVAILGSLLSTGYRSALEPALAGLPPQAAEAARNSLGAAIQVASRVGGPAGQALIAAANQAFIQAMSGAVLVAAGVVLVDALLVLLFLPAWERHPGEEVEQAERAERV